MSYPNMANKDKWAKVGYATRKGKSPTTKYKLH